MNTLKIIAHRGASFHEPENTISAIKKAIELNSDMVEVDARITKDNEIVIMHDSTVKRITGVKGLVKNMTLKEIKKLRVNGKEKIPTLQEVIDIVKGKCKLNIHIKNCNAIEKILEIIKDNNMHNEVLLSSFSRRTLKQIKKVDSRIKTAYIFRRPTPFYIKIAKSIKADYLHPYYQITTKRLIKKAHRHGFGVNVYLWMIMKRKAVLKLMLLGADGIIVDDPLIYKNPLFTKNK